MTALHQKDEARVGTGSSGRSYFGGGGNTVMSAIQGAMARLVARYVRFKDLNFEDNILEFLQH